MFYVYFCTPHEGLFMANTEDPAGPWKLHHIVDVEMQENSCYLRVRVDYPGKCTFFYSEDGADYKNIGSEFMAKKAVWIGAKAGIFCINPNITESEWYADFDFFRIE